MIMNVHEAKNKKEKCNERNDENKNQNKREKLMKNLNLKMNESSQRIQVESAERNNMS